MKKRDLTAETRPTKPVRPRPVIQHGLLGLPFVSQHMISDNGWTISSLSEEFHGMTELLAKRLEVKKTQAAETRRINQHLSHNLRRQCRDGRVKLNNVLYGDNSRKIRNILRNHTEMQRLYQKMPIGKVVENIDQRTFVMRKERDRLKCRLDQLNDELKKKLLTRAELENRVKYQNEFKVAEEQKVGEFRKKIENSKVRMNAIQAINTTYRKMIQVLNHDDIFYDPILRSLNKDVEDQEKFVEHILGLGIPAIASFKELNERYRLMTDKSHKNRQNKFHTIAWARKSSKRMSSMSKNRGDVGEDLSKRYVRETKSMVLLQDELKALEKTIKQIKFVTLCSQAREIYPRIKSQVENNKQLKKLITNNTLDFEADEEKMDRGHVLQAILINNLSENEITRLDRIKELKELIKKEDEVEQQLIMDLKHRNEMYVILRFSLWNLFEILRQVDRTQRPLQMKYPNSYLKLPLLKFEMYTMRACPPEPYDDNIQDIMQVVIRKVEKLMRVYKEQLTPEQTTKYVNRYEQEYLETYDFDEGEDEAIETKQVDSEDAIHEAKSMISVPTSKQIKAQSAKILEENIKKEEN